MALALSFALSTMTGLRFAGLPVGVAELIVLLCLVVHLPLGFGVHGGNPPLVFSALSNGDLFRGIARVHHHPE